MKIKEIQLLNEDFGTLKSIDPEILNLLTKQGYQNKKLLRPPLGRESEMKVFLVKNPQQAYKQLFSGEAIDGKKLHALILRAGAEQILYVADDSTTIINGPAYMQLEPDSQLRRDLQYKMSKNDRNRSWEPKFDKYTLMHHLTNAAAKKSISLVYDSIVRSGLPVSFLGVYEDEDRKAKRNNRADAINGVSYQHYHLKNLGKNSREWSSDSGFGGLNGRPEHKNYASAMKGLLQKRLEQFKASRSVQVKNPEEFLQTILKSGYLEKITLDGITYILNLQSLNLHGIMGKKPDKYSSEEKTLNNNFIKYVASPELSPKIKELKKQLEVYYDAYINSNEDTEGSLYTNSLYAKYKEEKAELEQTLPPRSFSIQFGVQGAAIVPIKIVPSEDKVYI